MEYCKNKEDDGNEDLLLIPCVDAPENLLRMYNRLPAAPNEFYIVDGQQIRLRNSAAWRPPKKHFIYELPKLQYEYGFSINYNIFLKILVMQLCWLCKEGFVPAVESILGFINDKLIFAPISINYFAICVFKDKKRGFQLVFFKSNFNT